MSSEGNLVKAIYSFKGKNNDELCFKKGDVITVTQREEGGWWEGTLGETTGWFPSNYVTECKDANGSLATSPIRAPSEIQAFRNVVLKDIIDSEKAHVAEMQALITNFLEPLEKSDILTRDEFKQLTGNIVEVVATHERLLALVEECGARTGPEQRVGGLFLQWAPRLQAVHRTYCAAHPRAVCILDKYKEELNAWMESAGAVCPGVLVLTAGLSKPFRRLGKFPAMLQELARHVHEAHPDRGDTHRASVVYKDIASECAALRRQKELELQVVTGCVRGWTGGPLSALGEVLHMGGVAVGAAHADRYLVLFPSALLLLSVSKRVSAFVYEGCLPLTGITVAKLDDTESRKNAFEISGPMIDTIVAVCQTKAEADNWVNLLQKHSNTGTLSINEANQPQSLPHLRRSPSEGALSSFNSGRRSLYHVTLPPESYPPASPYHSLTKYFAKLVRLKVITRPMLRRLLHERPWARAMEMAGVPVRRRHTNRLKLRIDSEGAVESETEYETDTDASGEETDSTESCSGSEPRMLRQDALDRSTLGTASTFSSGGTDFGYMRYFNSPSEAQLELPMSTESSNGQGMGAINHKRSHSFNNHHSYSQHMQAAGAAAGGQPAGAGAGAPRPGWLLNSCDSLSQPHSAHHSIGAKFSSLDFIDTASVNYTTKGWSISSLRPAAPLRPQWAAGCGAEESAHPYAPHQRKANSYEEDALVLRVIEAYCTSARCRNAVSSECEEERRWALRAEALVRSPSLPVYAGAAAPPGGLHSLLMKLHNEVKCLKGDVKQLREQLLDERLERQRALHAFRNDYLREAKETS